MKIVLGSITRELDLNMTNYTDFVYCREQNFEWFTFTLS